MRKIIWHSKTITTNADAEAMRNLYRTTQQTAAAFDTETTGLSHMRDKPFLYQFGWYDEATMEGYTWAVDIERQPQLAQQVIKVWHALVKNAPIYIGQNVKFDLHMLTNINLPYDGDNISELMAWIRLGTDAIAEKNGGAPLKLKKFAVRYIDKSAANHEKKIDEERTKIAKDLNLKLRKKLGWSQKDIDTFFKDKLNDVEDLPEDKREAYWDWHTNDLPEYLQPKVTGTVDSNMIAYNTLNREHVIEYGHLDIVWTLEAFHLLKEAVRIRGNLPAIAIEESNIYPIYEMERVGFKADKDYLQQSKVAVKEYIKQRRQDMYSIAGRELSVGQHALIKETLAEMGLIVPSTGKEELDIVLSKLKHTGENPVAADFIEVVQELRTLEKWYSTYIMRFEVDLKYSDMLYTTINLNTAVTGRVSSDFQQFPKYAIKTLDGRELFHPRKLFIVPDGYKGIVYLDYSQIELRVQALYTILVGEGDLNLCRAYMPYQCHMLSNSGKVVEFNYNSPEHMQLINKVDWFLNENSSVKWTPTDVHGATTKVAFNITEDDERFHDLRYIGKRVNFAKNYGAQRNKIAEMFPEFDDEDIDRIDGAYYKAFPGVKAYHSYCYAIANRQAYAQNLFGVRYYNVSGHNLINMLIQGTAAYILKTVIPKINLHLKNNGYQSKLQMQIHDELSFLWHEADDPKVFFEIKEIMEDFKDFMIPIVADIEVTYTNWAEKKEVKSIEELRTT